MINGEPGPGKHELNDYSLWGTCMIQAAAGRRAREEEQLPCMLHLAAQFRGIYSGHSGITQLYVWAGLSPGRTVQEAEGAKGHRVPFPLSTSACPEPEMMPVR